MKKHQKKRALQTLEITEKARQKLAEKVLTLDAIETGILEAAKAGLKKFVVKIKEPVNLKSTAQAKQVCEILSNNKYIVEWVDMTLEADDRKNPYKYEIKYTELNITW